MYCGRWRRRSRVLDNAGSEYLLVTTNHLSKSWKMELKSIVNYTCLVAFSKRPSISCLQLRAVSQLDLMQRRTEVNS
jgi:hypothetical protein